MLRYAVSKQRYQNAIATDAFSDLAVVQFRLLGFWFHPRLRGLFGAPRAVYTVQSVQLLVVELTGDGGRWLRL